MIVDVFSEMPSGDLHHGAYILCSFYLSVFPCRQYHSLDSVGRLAFFFTWRLTLKVGPFQPLKSFPGRGKAVVGLCTCGAFVALPLARCVTLGNLPDLSQPPHLQRPGLQGGPEIT